MADTVKAKSTLTKWQQFKLKMRLLEIWFIKNIFIFLWILFIVCVGLALGGYITKSTPVFGPIFGGISEDVRAILDENGANVTIYSVIESIISIGAVVALCATKMKRLGLEDIKSRKVKLLLIKAGLYFDENGKLTKRIETITSHDINGDGKIGDKPIEYGDGENIFKGIKRASEEFVTIVKLDLSEVEEDKQEEVYQHVGLDDEKEGIDDIIIETSNKTASLLDPTIDEAMDSEDKEVKKKNIFRRLGLAIKSFGSKLSKDIKMTKEMESTIKDSKDELKENIESAATVLNDNINTLGITDDTVADMVEIQDLDINLSENKNEESEEIIKVEEDKQEEVVIEQPVIKTESKETHKSQTSQNDLDSFLASIRK